MKSYVLAILAGAALLPSPSALHVQAGVLYPEPPGGWTYTYDGDQGMAGEPNSGFTSLDGTWSHDNGSDEWDGSAPGGTFGDGNRPGGAGIYEEGGITFLRIQDTGDPRGYGYADPGSNRKVYLGHDITAEGASDTVMDDGITLSFRARLPTPGKSTSPLDPLHRAGQEANGVQPFPAEGDGYVTSDGGKGNFVIKQGAGGAIAFSLSTLNDTGQGDPNGPKANFAGLTMNEFAGNAIAGNPVNFGMGTGTNVVAFDPTDWHEIWIVIRKDPANIGTHQGYVYLDGNFEPTVFKLTAGTGSDFGGSYIAIGSTATPQNSALDIDFVAYKLGVFFPGNAIDSLPPEIADVAPAQNATFQSASTGISFSVTTQGANTLPASGFSLTLNGEDVSAGINVTGPDQNRQATFTDLEVNTVYLGEIIVRDDAGRGSTNRLSFDTFSTASTVVIESEDYNLLSGLFVDDPPPYTFVNGTGTAEIDFHDTLAAPAGGNANFYRPTDPVGTESTLDYARSTFVDFGLTDIHVAGVQAGEWINYTRTIPAGRYNLHLRAASVGAQPVRIDRVTGDPTQPGQAVALLGTIDVPNSGNANVFGYGTLSDVNGQPLALSLSGVTTLRVTALAATGNLNMNYLVLAPASAPTAPQVAASPGPGAVGVAPDQTLQATIIDGPTAVSPSSVKIALDGQDATASATVTDLPEGVTVRFKPSNLLAGGSQHTLRVEYTGGNAEWSFTVASLPALPPSWATPASSVTGRPRGFSGRIHQVDNAASDGLFPNTIQRTMNQLAGLIIDPVTGQPFLNLAAGPSGDGSFMEPTAINYEQNGIPEGIPGDLPFPNLFPFDQNHIAMEVITYVEFPTGVIRLGVAADDGFVVYAGPSAAEATQVIGVREPGGGTVPVNFDFVVQSAGVYALKLLYFEGNGGADIEWYSEDRDTGVRSLLNADTSYRAFASRVGDGTAVSEPTAVELTAALAGGQIVISWPKTTPAFNLESSPTLSPAAWTAVTSAPTESNNTLTVRLTIGGGAFFRLTSQ